MKITTKSWPSVTGGSACIDYNGEPDDPATSVEWCIKIDSGWVFNSEDNRMYIRNHGGGWYIYAPNKNHPLDGVRFPSRRSIIAADRIGR